MSFEQNNPVPLGALAPVCEWVPILEGVRPLAVFRALVGSAGLSGGSCYFQKAEKRGDLFVPVETILATDPFEKIRIRKGIATLENEEGVSRAEGNPFSIIAARIRKYQLPRSPFFQGGALGYFSYDSVRFLEPKLLESAGNLRMAGESDTCCDSEFLFFRKLMVFDHLGGRVGLVSGYFPGKQSREDGLRQAEAEIRELQAILGAGAPSCSEREWPSVELATEEMRPMLGKQGFLDGVRKLKEHIKAGDIFQAVLSEKFSAPFEGCPLDLFEILSRINPSPYQFCFSSGKQVMLGASPEMLLKVTGTELETHPIAGTRPRGATEAEEKKHEAQLLRSVKEKAEHLMLVDLARNDIGRVSKPGSVQLDSFMELRKFGSVMHLVSRVKGALKEGLCPIEALASCFPAGTLSGAPKVRAMQLLSGIEPQPRGFYGGALVAASFSGDLDSCIAIRCVQVEEGIAIVQAGAGVVADSQPEREYAEIQHKTRMTRKALALAREGLPGKSPGEKPGKDL